MIGFRVDANETIATGHLMRCLSIAEICRKKGEECLFLLAEAKETNRIEARGFSYTILHSDWKNMEGELEYLFDIIQEKKIRKMVVDSYQATVEYLSRLENKVPVLYIDDMEQEVYPVSAVLHYGINSASESYLKKYKECNISVLAGMQYIPLREEFMPEKHKTAERKDRIMITTGGTDPFHIAERFLNYCIDSKESSVLRNYEFDVIVGALYDDLTGLERLAEKHREIHLHQNVSNMSDYMYRCRAAVSAGGTTLYELCACGIPTICFSFSDNQKPGTVAFGDCGVMAYAGDARETDVVKGLFLGLEELFTDRELYDRRQKLMQELVDGKGSERIAFFLSTMEH